MKRRQNVRRPERIPRNRPGRILKFEGAQGKFLSNGFTKRAAHLERRKRVKQRYCVTWFHDNLDGFPVWAASASTSFISAIHWLMASAVNNPICLFRWVDPPRSSELCRLVSSVLLFLPFSDSKGSFSSWHQKQTDAEEINLGRQTEVNVQYKVHQEDKVSWEKEETKQHSS